MEQTRDGIIIFNLYLNHVARRRYDGEFQPVLRCFA